MKLFVAGFLAAILVLIAVVAAVIYSGAYNVAADAGHTAVETRILDAAMTNSVKARAGSIMSPRGFDDDRQVEQGFRLYDEMCVECHGAPGKQAGEVGVGLMPGPPDLSQTIGRWTAGEIFWILKHGIKATGMPSFGKTHSDGQLWSLVAFVRKLQGLTPERYKALDATRGPMHDHDHRHETGPVHDPKQGHDDHGHEHQH
jgi:mono/diheme cytochrome c family protein